MRIKITGFESLGNFSWVNTQNENGLKNAMKRKYRCYVSFFDTKIRLVRRGLTFGSIGFIYRPLSSENITFFALPAFPRRLCACCAKKRSFSSTKPPSASKINSSGICSCCSSFSSSLSSCLGREPSRYNKPILHFKEIFNRISTVRER